MGERALTKMRIGLELALRRTARSKVRSKRGVEFSPTLVEMNCRNRCAPTRLDEAGFA